MDETDLIKERKSIRAYNDDEVPEYVIDDVLDCARLAPTARNIQPWLIGAVTDKKLLQELGGLSDTGPFIADAGACFTVFCLRDEKYFLEDGCAAVENILLAATTLGLGTCWVAGDKKHYSRIFGNLLSIPTQFKLIALIAVGYENGDLPRKKKRSLTEVLHWEKY